MSSSTTQPTDEPPQPERLDLGLYTGTETVERLSLPSQNVRIQTTEHIEEMRSRLKREEADNEFKHQQEAAEAEFKRKEAVNAARHERRIQIGICGFAIALTLICFWIIIFSPLPTDMKNNSWSLITLIGGGLLGYLTGRASK